MRQTGYNFNQNILSRLKFEAFYSIITTVNSLEKFTEEQIEAEADEGYVSIHFKTNPNTERGKLLMDSLILGLTEIEHSYNNRYLTVRVKEV